MVKAFQELWHVNLKIAYEYPASFYLPHSFLQSNNNTSQKVQHTECICIITV